MNIRQFSTDAYSLDLRRDAWRSALQPHSIDVRFAEDADEPFYGHLSTVVSFAGVRFACARSRRQRFEERFSDSRDTIWLVLLLEGRAHAPQGADTLTLRPGDILCGRTRKSASLTLETDFTALLVDVPPSFSIQACSRRCRARPSWCAEITGSGGCSRAC